MLGASIGLLPREAKRLTLPELDALIDADRARHDRFCRVVAWAVSVIPYAVHAGIGLAFDDKFRLQGWAAEDLVKFIPGYEGEEE
jgi:hypothetical protein